MTDSTEVIRQKMDQTKSRLAENLQMLQLQIAENARATGVTVKAAVEAAKDTVETVQKAAKSVNNAFDVRRRISMHPWIVLGTCVGLGYLAGRRRSHFFGPFLKTSEGLKNNQGGFAATAHSTDSAAMASAIVAAYEKGLRNSYWGLLRDAVIAAAIEVLQETATRAVPQIIDRLTGSQTPPRGDLSEEMPSSQKDCAASSSGIA